MVLPKTAVHVVKIGTWICGYHTVDRSIDKRYMIAETGSLGKYILIDMKTMKTVDGPAKLEPLRKKLCSMKWERGADVDVNYQGFLTVTR